MAETEHVAITSSTYFPTWYQGPLRSIKHTDKIRGDLALEFVEKALAKGYWLVVTDGFSTKTFQKKLSSLNTGKLIIIKRRAQGRSMARRLAFQRATRIPDVRAILYTEAEKVSLIDFIPELVQPIIKAGVDIVVPKREASLFKQTYPRYMYESESDGNILYNEHLHMHGFLPKEETFDMFFGPRVFAANKRVISLYHQRVRFQVGSNVLQDEYFNPEELSDALFFPIVLALKRKLKVKSVTIPFRYPTLQKQNEEIGDRYKFEEKRRLQRMSLLIELMHFLAYLQRYKHS